MCAPHGTSADVRVRPEWIEALLDAKPPYAARSWLATLRSLCQFAIKRGWLRTDPTAGIKQRSVKSDGFHCWTDDEIAQFEAYHAIGSKPRLALALLLYTAQRRSDVVRMGRQHIRETSDGPAPYVKQQKTGVELLIPIYPELQTILGLRRALVTPSQQNVRAAVSEAQIKILMDEAINLHSNELEASRDWQAVVDRTGAIVRWLLRWCDFGFRRSCTILNRMEGQLRRGGERDASELLEIR